jgi:hypothetical protein
MVAVPSADSAVTANKTCGECTLCCKVMAIEQLAKPVGVVPSLQAGTRLPDLSGTAGRVSDL